MSEAHCEGLKATTYVTCGLSYCSLSLSEMTHVRVWLSRSREPDSGFKFPGWATNLIGIVAWLPRLEEVSCLFSFMRSRIIKEHGQLIESVVYLMYTLPRNRSWRGQLWARSCPEHLRSSIQPPRTYTPSFT